MQAIRELATSWCCIQLHDPEHVPDHILSTLIGTSVTLLAENGALVLGTWQRVILVELDGPRQREIAIGFVSTE